MTRLAAVVRLLHGREPLPSIVMIDAQTVKGGRYGPTFHQAGGPGGRTIGTKRTILVEILGLPIAAQPQDVTAARELLRDRLADLPRVHAIVGDRAYRGLLKLAERKRVRLEIKAPPKGTRGFTPLWSLYKIEHTIAQLGRWRRLSRCYEGSEASARAWLEVASVGYLALAGWRPDRRHPDRPRDPTGPACLLAASSRSPSAATSAPTGPPNACSPARPSSHAGTATPFHSRGSEFGYRP